MIVAIRPTASEVRAPHTMRAQMSQPWKVKPSGCPSAGPPFEFASWQSSLGGVWVNSVGQTAIEQDDEDDEQRDPERRALAQIAPRVASRCCAGFASTRTASTDDRRGILHGCDVVRRHDRFT